MSNEIIEQTPFSGLGFADNPEPRCPCVLILDKSGSMAGSKIAQLNEAVRFFQQELMGDDLAKLRVEVAVVSFGPLTVDAQFSAPVQFIPPNLEASGDTPMGAAVMRAIDMVNERKKEYRTNGISFYRPWLVLMTDGAPTDSIAAAAAAIREGEAAKKFAFFAVGVDQADMDQLKQLSVRPPLMMNGIKFREFFLWLSSSMKTVSHSTPQTEGLALPSTAGWASL
jgi:uncharacterized protein YegL